MRIFSDPKNGDKWIEVDHPDSEVELTYFYSSMTRESCWHVDPSWVPMNVDREESLCSIEIVSEDEMGDDKRFRMLSEVDDFCAAVKEYRKVVPPKDEELVLAGDECAKRWKCAEMGEDETNAFLQFVETLPLPLQDYVATFLGAELKKLQITIPITKVSPDNSRKAHW